MELFVDPTIRFPKLRIANRLARKLLGFRYYMDMIGLDAGIVRGSHGRLPDKNRLSQDGPVLICSSKRVERDELHAMDVRNLLLNCNLAVDAGGTANFPPESCVQSDHILCAANCISDRSQVCKRATSNRPVLEVVLHRHFGYDRL